MTPEEQQKVTSFLALLNELATKHNINNESERNTYFKLKLDDKGVGYDISDTQHPFIDEAKILFYEHFRLK